MGQALKIPNGKRYGRLVVTAPAGKNALGHQLLNCRCDCGREKAVTAGSLRSGGTQSCGCLGRETFLAMTTHGHNRRGQKSGTYKTWLAMRNRCHRDYYIGYANYGARGISMCKAWRDSFESFLNDMGERPTGHSIDRIDNRFGYFPANCRWATSKQQHANKTHGNQHTSYKHWPKLAALIAASPYRQQQETIR